MLKLAKAISNGLNKTAIFRGALMRIGRNKNLSPGIRNAAGKTRKWIATPYARRKAAARFTRRNPMTAGATSFGADVARDAALSIGGGIVASKVMKSFGKQDPNDG